VRLAVDVVPVQYSGTAHSYRHIAKAKARHITGYLSLPAAPDPRRASHQRKPSAGRICGKLKLSLSYSSDSLKVMVLHIQNLGFSDQAREEPNAYVKVQSPQFRIGYDCSPGLPHARPDETDEEED
jgi:hypothetical protein